MDEETSDQYRSRDCDCPERTKATNLQYLVQAKNMMSLFERRRGIPLKRTFSQLLIGECRSSPEALNEYIAAREHSQSVPCQWYPADTDVVVSIKPSCSFSVEQDVLEIRDLTKSPTDRRRKVWSFTPAHSPETSTPASPDPAQRSVSPRVHTPGRCTPCHTPSRSTPGRSTPCHTPGRSTPGRCTPTSLSSSLRKLTNRFRGSHDNRRQMVISEIIDTEQRYISNLETLLNVFLPALEDVVAPRDLRLIFPAQLEPLLERHKDFLEQLEEREGRDCRYRGIFGDIFAQLCTRSNSEFVNMYSAYMNEFKVAMRTLARYEQNSQQFREVLQAIQHSRKCVGLALSSFLLTPVQRMPRYELLLKELLKMTPLDHPDHYYLGDAIDRLREEMVRLNQSIKSCQLACSVAKFRNGRKPSFIRFARRRSIRTTPRLKRHISTSNIDEYSSGSENGTPISRIHHDTSIYKSAESLADTDETPYRGGGGNVRLMGSKAASCSNLLLEFNERRKPSLPAIDSLPSIPSTPVMEEPPSSPSTSSAIPPSSEESYLRSRSRVSSVYSTTSSTSGFGSLGDLASTLTPSDCDPQSLSSTPTEKKERRKHSWSTTLKVPRKRTSVGERRTSKTLDISSPMDFRHIQHGFTKVETSDSAVL